MAAARGVTGPVAAARQSAALQERGAEGPALTLAGKSAPGPGRPGWRIPLALAASAWVLGSLFLTLRLVVGWRRLRRLARDAQAPPFDWRLAELQGVRQALSLNRLPPIALCRGTRVPMVVGLVHPRVVLPEALAVDMSPSELTETLIHECAHVRRRDQWVLAVQRLALVVFWPHPLLHYLNRELERAREELCDNHVLAASRPAAYAETLLRLAQVCLPPPEWGAGTAMVGRGTHLEQRIRSLVDTHRERDLVLARWPRLGVALLMALLVAGVSAVQVRLGAQEFKTAGYDPPEKVIDEAVQREVRAAALSPTNYSGARIRFDGTVFDFGKVVSGTEVKHTFFFTNTGLRDLIVSNVQAGCHCTVVSNWMRQVRPGESGAIPVVLQTGSDNWPVVKLITVTCNDATLPRGTVMLQLKGTVWKPVQVIPSLLALNIRPDFPAISASAQITNALEELMMLSAPQCSSPLFVAHLKTNALGRDYTLIVSNSPALPPGVAQGVVSIRTSLTNFPVLTVNLWANSQLPVTFVPASIALRQAPLATNQVAFLTIINNCTNPIALSEPLNRCQGREHHRDRKLARALLHRPAQLRTRLRATGGPRRHLHRQDLQPGISEGHRAGPPAPAPRRAARDAEAAGLGRPRCPRDSCPTAQAAARDRGGSVGGRGVTGANRENRDILSCVPPFPPGHHLPRAVLLVGQPAQDYYNRRERTSYALLAKLTGLTPERRRDPGNGEAGFSS